MSEIKLKIKPSGDDYKKCSCCNMSYMNMMRIFLKIDGYGYILLCKICYKELKDALCRWE